MRFVESLSACVGTTVKIFLLSCSPEGYGILTSLPYYRITLMLCMILWTHIYYLITMVMFNNLWYYCNCYVIVLSFSLCFSVCLIVFSLLLAWQWQCFGRRAYSHVWLSSEIDGVNKMWLFCIIYYVLLLSIKLFYDAVWHHSDAMNQSPHVTMSSALSWNT